MAVEREGEVMATLMGLVDLREGWGMEQQDLGPLGLHDADGLTGNSPYLMLNMNLPMFGVVSKPHGARWRETHLTNAT
jgi:hypothetical protein